MFTCLTDECNCDKTLRKSSTARTMSGACHLIIFAMVDSIAEIALMNGFVEEKLLILLETREMNDWNVSMILLETREMHYWYVSMTPSPHILLI